MTDFSSFNVTRKIFSNNTPKTPTDHNSEVVEKKQYDMAHPQRIEEPRLTDLLNTLDVNNLDKNTSGLMRSADTGDGWFHLTPGVLKFKPSHNSPPGYPPTPPASDTDPYPPINPPPANDTDPYTPPDGDVTPYTPPPANDTDPYPPTKPTTSRGCSALHTATRRLSSPLKTRLCLNQDV